jgi:hypothetical protein
MTEPMQYEVEKILSHRGGPVRKAATKYFVKWAGYSKNDNTWEPAGRLESTVKELVGFYWYDKLVAEKRLSEMSENKDSSRKLSDTSDISEMEKFYETDSESATPSNSELTVSENSDSEMPETIDSDYDSEKITEIIDSNDLVDGEVIREIAAIAHPFLMSLKKEIIQTVDAKMEHLLKVTQKQNIQLIEKIANELKNKKKQAKSVGKIKKKFKLYDLQTENQ